jgi:protocatechuate 3,4-dioxygenase, alpha subunit
VSLGRTPSQTVGPYYAIGLERRRENELAADGVELHGTLFDGAGGPIADGVIELWDAAGGRWGRCGTEAGGRFSFFVAKPEPVAGHAPHLDVFVFARGLLRHQLTRIYFPDEQDANAADPTLGSLSPDEGSTLVAVHEGGTLRFDIRMQGDSATVFFAH